MPHNDVKKIDVDIVIIRNNNIYVQTTRYTQLIVCDGEREKC